MLLFELAAYVKAGDRHEAAPASRRASWASRVSIAVGPLSVCAGCARARVDAPAEPVVIALLALFGLAILFPISVGLAVLIGRRPVRRRLLKILVSATAGGVCGMLWVVFIATICAADRPGVLTDPVLIVVGVVVALSGAVLISGPGRLGEVVGRSLVTTGFTSLALPIAALISFLVTGAQVSPGSSSRSELNAVILGVRLAGDVTTASLSVGGLLAGVFLVFLGDRQLRHVRLARRRKAAATTPIRGPFPN
jgi:hypothetical protein